jgi:MoaA/NifB/PqqE/SkfB family radical SAM enzyme
VRGKSTGLKPGNHILNNKELVVDSPAVCDPNASRIRYDIEADFGLLDTCNYRCEYCFCSPDKLEKKLTVHAEPETWRRVFDRTGLTWLLHITGGEPTIYPRFAELCQLLTSTHYVSFNSNLTHASVVDIAKCVDPSRISFINAGLHAKERERRRGLATFLKHAESLLESNFPLFISVVSTPDVLSRVDEIIALTAPIGIAPLPKLLRGLHKGKIYPEAYSAEERSAFLDFTARACESYGPRLHSLRQRPSIDVFEDGKYVDGVPEFHGRMCSAGEKFVRLEPDGKVYRCEQKPSNYLGNILDGSFQPSTGKSRCDSSYCFYFCLKYADTTAMGSTTTSFHTELSRGIGDFFRRKVRSATDAGL